jgi:hypothetical protein
MGELTSEDKLLNALRERKKPREVARFLNPWSQDEQPPVAGTDEIYLCFRSACGNGHISWPNYRRRSRPFI